jgi:hypothetical protein
LNKFPETVKFVGKIIGPEINRRRKLMDERGGSEKYSDLNVCGIIYDITQLRLPCL